MPSMTILTHPVESEGNGILFVAFEEYNKTLLTFVRNKFNNSRS